MSLLKKKKKTLTRNSDLVSVSVYVCLSDCVCGFEYLGETKTLTAVAHSFLCRSWRTWWWPRRPPCTAWRAQRAWWRAWPHTSTSALPRPSPWTIPDRTARRLVPAVWTSLALVPLASVKSYGRIRSHFQWRSYSVIPLIFFSCIKIFCKELLIVKQSESTNSIHNAFF